MIDVVINKQKWRCPTAWEEITLSKAMALERLIENTENDVKECFASAFEPSACEPEQEVVDSARLRDFYADVLAVMADIPQEVCRVPRRLWFIRWGTKELRQEIVSSNPHTRITYNRCVRLSGR